MGDREESELRRTSEKKIQKMILLGVLTVIIFVGCRSIFPKETKNSSVLEESTEKGSMEDDAKIIEGVYHKVYEETKENDFVKTLEKTRKIVNCIGKEGYSVIDRENQIDMTHAEQVLLFCEAVNMKKIKEQKIVEIIDLDWYAIYDFKTENGEVDVGKRVYHYEKGEWKKTMSGTYRAVEWNYSEDGFLMFSGSLKSKELYVLTLSDAKEQNAFRVLPLNETYRELNRKYIIPISYERNNMFLVDWNENDYGKLDFYDLYDIFYSYVNGQEIPYTPDENLGVGAVYEIPKDDFEEVIQTYFHIESETLQAKTIYNQEKEVYEYRPRGFKEVEYPEYPFPEVVGYTENEDKTISLIVNVVFPYRGISKVYTHEVTVRPLSDGTFRYVSNRILPSEENNEKTWHTDRLSVEEYEKVYEKTNVYNMDNSEETEKEYHLPISKQEKEEAKNDCSKNMKLIAEIYEKANKINELNGTLSDEMLEKMAEEMKKAGSCVRTDNVYSNMGNYEKFESFLLDSIAGKKGTAVLYKIYRDGGLRREKYVYDGKDMYVLPIRAVRGNANKVSIPSSSYTKLKEWKYTENGWFGYKLCAPEYPEVTEVIDSSCLIRVKPISGKNREMSEKCVFGIGYQGNNLLCSDWNVENLNNLDYNGLYEYLYGIKYQQRFQPEKYIKGIPKEEFENLMMEYLPISAEKLKEYAVFDDKTQMYAWERLGCGNYSPTLFGTSVPEVVDIKENTDGTVTLKVNAVCDTVLCDDAVITHELTLKFKEDGSFQYLGNKILEDGLTAVPNYQYRIGKNIK